MGARPVPRPAAFEPERNRKCQSDEEAASMCPVCDATKVRIGIEATKKLHCKPEPEHDEGGYGNDAKEDDQNDQYIDARLWEHQEIAPHHARDRTGCSD